MYWRVKRLWPSAPEYTAERFGQQRVADVVEALAQGTRLQFEELHYSELGIATLISCYINANRNPKKSKAVEPSDFHVFDQNKSKRLPSAAANVFFDLVNAKKMPRWAVGVAPVKKLQDSRNNVPVTGPRAWVGDGVVLLRPSATRTEVTAQIALLASNQTTVTVTDIDNGQRYVIELPQQLAKVKAYSLKFECPLKAKYGPTA